jgi:hypothetical protein
LAGRRPADFAATAATANQISGFRICRDEVDEAISLDLTPDFGCVALKDRSFGNGAHGSDNTALP